MDKRKTYPLGRTLARLIDHAKNDEPSVFWYCGAHTLVAGIFPLIAVLTPKLVLAELTRAAGARAEMLLWIVGLLFAASALLGYGKAYFNLSARAKIIGLRIDYLRAYCVKHMGMAYRYIEDAAFLAQYDQATSAPDSSDAGIERVYMELMEAPAEGLALLILLGLIGVFSPWILLALVVHVGVRVWINRRVHAFRHGLAPELGRARRRRKYYQEATHDFGYGKDIRIYGLQGRILEKYRQEIRAYVQVLEAIARREFALGFVGLGTLLLSDGLTYGLLIAQAVKGLPIADFSMYLTAVVTLSALMAKLAERVTTILNEGHYVHDFFDFMDLDLGEQGGDLPAVQGDTLEIVFDDVSFRYPGSEKYVLRNFNLRLEKGQRLAIVGINGAGKSTLVKLMTGLFAPTEGEIRINGVPIERYEKGALYSMFSVVFQEVNVLAFPLVENVSCGLEADRPRAQEALERAGLGDKLRSLDKGLDQPMLKIIEEDGTEFSGGESQKLTIARALYKDANMIIMDEPTAALDALAEAEIYQGFARLVEGKTAVYISHRLASTKFCDKIAFMDGDGLKEYGSHEELMALKGSYHHMFTVQGKYYALEEEGGVA